MSKHTPGPYHLVRYTGHAPKHHGYPGAIVAKDGTEVFSGPFSFWALHGRTDAEALANAHLFKAAPDLLKSLRELVNSPNAKKNNMWDRARAAIARADGDDE